ncbi:MAG: tail fiber assembly protein, partial [Aeromonas veronii]
KEQEGAARFAAKRAKAMATTEARIAPLERARRLGMATPEELAELEALERYTITLMREEGPEVPAFDFAH